jgi:hypothetical protein
MAEIKDKHCWPIVSFGYVLKINSFPRKRASVPAYDREVWHKAPDWFRQTQEWANFQKPAVLIPTGMQFLCLSHPFKCETGLIIWTFKEQQQHTHKYTCSVLPLQQLCSCAVVLILIWQHSCCKWFFLELCLHSLLRQETGKYIVRGDANLEEVRMNLSIVTGDIDCIKPNICFQVRPL